MANTIKELREEHRKQEEDFTSNCPHIDIVVEDSHFGNRRAITLRCATCRENLLGYTIDKPQSYLAYVKDCVKEYPGNIRNIEGSSYYKARKSKD